MNSSNLKEQKVKNVCSHLNDLERLLEIKSLLEKGFNIKGIKQIIYDSQEHLTTDEQEIRKR